MSLITVDQALAHLNLTPDITDQRMTDVRQKMAQAEAIVLDRCGSTAHWQTEIEAWTDEETVPKAVQAAILLQLEELFTGRDLTQMVELLIGPHKDPVVA